MTDTESDSPTCPAGDVFSNEDGSDWFWCGSHTEKQALEGFCNDPDEGDDEPEVTKVRANVSGDGDGGYTLWFAKDGQFEFWQVEGGIL